MTASASDDDELLGDIFKSGRVDPSSKRSDSGSPLPDWLSDNASPDKTPLELLSDSDEVVEVASEDDPTQKEAGPGLSSTRGSQKAKPAAEENVQNGKRKRAHNQALESSDEEVIHATEAPVAGGQTPAQKRQKAADMVPARGAAKKTTSVQQKGIKAFLKAPAAHANGSASQPHSDAGGAEKHLKTEPQPDAPQLQQRKSTAQPAAAAETPAKAGKAAQAAKAAALAPVAGEIPIMLPENLQPSKFIVELEAGNDSAMDLAGDAGVVGRWLVEGDDKDVLLKMDLKGVVYAATTVPCATTLCVVNLSATEARVEALATQYIQLRAENRPSASGDGDSQDNYFMYDDDDNYQYEAGTQNREHDDDGEGPGAKKAGAKKKQRACAGPAAKKPGVAKRGAAAKPARKKAGKPAAGAKGKGKK